MRTLAALILLVTTLLPVLTARADVPQLIPVQGFLSDSDGKPIEGEHRLTFLLHDAAQGGELLFADDYRSLVIQNGHFTVYLGSQDSKPLDLALFAGTSEIWLEVVIDGDETISPRTRLGTVPYAAFALQCGGASEADHADLADHATNADHADQATNADRATSAATATSATTATTAGTADVAHRVEVVYDNIGPGDTLGGFGTACLANPGLNLECSLAANRKCGALGYSAGTFVGESADGSMRSIWCLR